MALNICKEITLAKYGYYDLETTQLGKRQREICN
jgi:hypothetical protein